MHTQGSCAIFINILDFVDAGEIAKFTGVSKRVRDKIIPTLIKWTDRRILKNFQLLKRQNKTFLLFPFSKHLVTIGKDLRWKEHKPLIDQSTMEPFEGLRYQNFSQCYLDAERSKIFVSGGLKDYKKKAAFYIYPNEDHVFMIDIKTGLVSRLAPMIKPRNSHASISVGGKVYCVGGIILNPSMTKSLTHTTEIYYI